MALRRSARTLRLVAAQARLRKQWAHSTTAWHLLCQEERQALVCIREVVPVALHEEEASVAHRDTQEQRKSRSHRSAGPPPERLAVCGGGAQYGLCQDRVRAARAARRGLHPPFPAPSGADDRKCGVVSLSQLQCQNGRAHMQRSRPKSADLLERPQQELSRRAASALDSSFAASLRTTVARIDERLLSRGGRSPNICMGAR